MGRSLIMSNLDNWRTMRRKKNIKFKPTSDFLRKAVSDYLKKGGVITKIELDEKSYRDFIITNENTSVVDEFLGGAW